jgi:hypothetical protein
MRKDNIFFVNQKCFVLEFFLKVLPNAVQGHLVCCCASQIGRLS